MVSVEVTCVVVDVPSPLCLIASDLFPSHWRGAAAVWRSRNVPFALVVVVDHFFECGDCV